MSKLISIGNSKGIRIPKTIIQQAHLENSELELIVLEDGLLIKPTIKLVREDWVEDIQKKLKGSDEGFLDDFLDDSDLEDCIW